MQDEELLEFIALHTDERVFAIGARVSSRSKYFAIHSIVFSLVS